MRCIVYKSYLSGSGHLLVFCPHEGDVLLMLGCSTDLDNSDRSVCRSVDGEREKSIKLATVSFNLALCPSGRIPTKDILWSNSSGHHLLTILQFLNEIKYESSGVSGISFVC